MAKLLKRKRNEQIGLREVERRSLGAGFEGRSKRYNRDGALPTALRAFGGSSALPAIDQLSRSW
jgi:hypothetical protein